MSQAIPGAPAAVPASPFRERLGIVIERMEAGTAIVAMPESPDQLNANGTIHGGALATLMDVAVSMAARSYAVSAQGVVTVSLTTNFLRAARGMLRANARVLNEGKSILTVAADIVDLAGATVASGTAVMKTIRARQGAPAGEE